MNGPSISRKAVGRKPVGAGNAGAAVIPTTAVPIHTSTTPGYRPHFQTPAPVPASGPPHPVQANASPLAHQHQQWQSLGSPTTSYTPTTMATPAPILTPMATPSPHQSVPQYHSQVPPASVAPRTVATPTAVSRPPTMGPGTSLPVSTRPPHVMQPGSPPVAASQAGHLYAVPTPTATPPPGQLRRTATTGSMQSIPSEYGRRTSTVSSVAPNTPSTPGTVPAAIPYLSGTTPAASNGGTESTICASCKQAIAPNVSIFICLVCTTAQITTEICVWCYTTGAGAKSHPHDASFYATDSDLRIQGPTGNIPSNIWTVRKNASGRLWYSHVQTGFKTHLRPMTATLEDESESIGLLGWQELKTPDGKLYYRHSVTGATSWTKPVTSLPSGWRMVKTPDNKPFYVHDGFQISTWDRPGEQPAPRLPPRTQTAPAASSGSAGTVTRPGNSALPGKGSVSAGDVRRAASVANNVAKLSAASDLSASGIYTATVAAAKLTGLGVKIAGKKMGRLGKGNRLSMAANFIGTAARLAGDDGGEDGFDGGGDIEEAEEEEPAETPDPEAVDPGYTDANQTATFPSNPPESVQVEVYYGEQPMEEQQLFGYPQPTGFPPEPLFAEECMIPPQPTDYANQPVLVYEATSVDPYALPPHDEAYGVPQELISFAEQPGYFPEQQPSYQYPPMLQTMSPLQQGAVLPQSALQLDQYQYGASLQPPPAEQIQQEPTEPATSIIATVGDIAMSVDSILNNEVAEGSQVAENAPVNQTSQTSQTNPPTENTQIQQYPQQPATATMTYTGPTGGTNTWQLSPQGPQPPALNQPQPAPPLQTAIPNPPLAYNCPQAPVPPPVSPVQVIQPARPPLNSPLQAVSPPPPPGPPPGPSHPPQPPGEILPLGVTPVQPQGNTHVPNPS